MFRSHKFFRHFQMLPRRGVVAPLALLLVLGWAAGALAQASPSYDLSRSLVTTGGGVRQSPAYFIEDVVGLPAPLQAASANYQLAGSYLGAFTPAGGDSFEADDSCAQAKVIDTVGTKQAHTFHYQGDNDWLRFTAVAGKTYIIEVRNLGTKSYAVVELLDTCDAPPATQESNAFGSLVTVNWDSVKSGDYFVKLQQFDPSQFGADANYEVSIRVDTVPPQAPLNPRCVAVNTTTLGIQWRKSLERDVKQYRISFTGPKSGNEDVFGADTTYYELGDLFPNQTYNFRVLAVDYSGNESAPSGQVECRTEQPPDTTLPIFGLNQPSGGTLVTTSSNLLTFNGNASDSGNNLSRAHVRNITGNKEGWDYSLTGGSDDFRVPDLPIAIGDNQVEVTIYDAAGNTTTQSLTVRRVGQASGAVLIVAGRNETFGLQLNIYNAAQRAYRIFKSAGYTDDAIYYIAPVASQDADGDGNNDVDAVGTPAAVQHAVTTWAAEPGRVGADKPFTVYLIDHGFVDKYCVTGCGDAGKVSPADLDSWLRALETATGVDQVNVVMEACQSGSFLDRSPEDVLNSLSKVGRVVITSTGRNNNAYASAQGAYFSDAFFSCAADSGSLKACFDEAKAAVATTGVAQTPWLDDNGDGLYDDKDGAVAQTRFFTKFFSSSRPQIVSTKLERTGANGLLTAVVQEGAEALNVVYAVIYAPSFQEPTDVTINLNAPTVRLEPVSGLPGSYNFSYPSGFPEEGNYRIVFYAEDRLGIQATPKREGETPAVYLPIVQR